MISVRVGAQAKYSVSPTNLDFCASRLVYILSRQQILISWRVAKYSVSPRNLDFCASRLDILSRPEIMISVRVDFNILCSPTNHDFLASGNLNTDFITMSRQQILIVVRAVPAVTIYRCLGQSLGLPLPKKPLVMRVTP